LQSLSLNTAQIDCTGAHYSQPTLMTKYFGQRELVKFTCAVKLGNAKLFNI